LTIDDPKIVALVIGEQAGSVVAQWRFHMAGEGFLSLKEMTVGVDDHILPRAIFGP
jgi:hypothetical protein